MSRIKNETGTSIIIPPDESKSSVIRIEGDPKGVAAAKAMLLEMSAKMVCKGGREGERERERGREGEREGGREGGMGLLLCFIYFKVSIFCGY